MRILFSKKGNALHAPWVASETHSVIYPECNYKPLKFKDKLAGKFKNQWHACCDWKDHSGALCTPPWIQKENASVRSPFVEQDS